MIRNYLLVAIRNFKRNYVFTGINILGLTLGLAISSIILLYLVNELTYDSYHKDSKSIYRLYRSIDYGFATASGPKVNAPLAPYLKEHYSEIAQYTRVSEKNIVKLKIPNKPNEFTEELFYTDSSFFDIFSLEFKYGNKNSALLKPYSLVLTNQIAEKYFGKTNPIGKEIILSKNTYIVSGVIKEIPENSHFKFNILSSFSTLSTIEDYKGKIEGWGSRYMTFISYIKLKSNSDISKLTKEFPKVVDLFLSQNPNHKYTLSAQPIEDIYLHHGGGGSLNRIILFGIICILILIIPCINYINLNTSQSIKRLKEVGVRKVIGAYKKQLISQFLFESILISILSLIFAITIAELILPIFNSILDKHLAFNYSENWILTIGFVIIALIVGLIAGSYPAFYLSSFNITDALKGKLLFGSRKAFFRNVFVILQFVISIFLICSSSIIFMQLRHSNKIDLGIDKDNILMLDLRNSEIKDPNIIKNEISNIPEIKNLSITGAFPFMNTYFDMYYKENPEDNFHVEVYNANQEFVELFGIKLIQGRLFKRSYTAEKNNILVNETLAKKLNLSNAIGEKIIGTADSTEYTIIGVIADFHRASLHQEIQPVLIACQENVVSYYMSLAIKTHEGKLKTAALKIQNICKKLNPDWIYSIRYLDEEIRNDYKNDLQTGYMFLYFSIIAIFITLIGLYALALYISQQKSKEIGIRKVFGASTNRIVKLLTFQFLKTILISLLIALPAAYYYSENWLNNFAYKFDNRWTVFVFASIMVIVISSCTLIYQSIRAALANPIDSIRYE